MTSHMSLLSLNSVPYFTISNINQKLPPKDDVEYSSSEVDSTDDSDCNLSKTENLAKITEVCVTHENNENSDTSFVFKSRVLSTSKHIDLSTSKRKKSFGIYCKCLITNLPRHLECIHSNVPDVAKLIGLPKGSLERRRIIDMIRNNGNYEYNTSSTFNKVT